MVNTKVEIDGIKYHLGLGFLDYMIDESGKSLEEIGILPNLRLIPLLMFYSRAYSCKINNEDIKFTKDDIFDYIDNNGGLSGENVSKFFSHYLECMKNHMPSDDKKKAKAVKQ